MPVWVLVLIGSAAYVVVGGLVCGLLWRLWQLPSGYLRDDDEWKGLVWGGFWPFAVVAGVVALLGGFIYCIAAMATGRFERDGEE